MKTGIVKAVTLGLLVLLGAVVDKRVGGENLDSVVDTWSGANAGLEWWAKRTRFFLCMARHPVGCEKP